MHPQPAIHDIERALIVLDGMEEIVAIELGPVIARVPMPESIPAVLDVERTDNRRRTPGTNCAEPFLGNIPTTTLIVIVIDAHTRIIRINEDQSIRWAMELLGEHVHIHPFSGQRLKLPLIVSLIPSSIGSTMQSPHYETLVIAAIVVVLS